MRSGEDKSRGMYKIAFVANTCSMLTSFFAESGRYLHENGYEVSLIARDVDDDFKKRFPWAKCFAVPSLKRGFTLKTWGAIRELKAIFEKERFDVVQYMTPNAAYCAAVASEAAKIPHRIYWQSGIRYVGFKKGIRYWMSKRIEKSTCRKSTAIRASTQRNLDFAVREKLCQKDKIMMLGAGGQVGANLKLIDEIDAVDAKEEIRKKYNIPEDAFVYIFVGRINRDKGVNELLRAFFRLSKEDDKVYLILVGAYDELNRINSKLYEESKAHPRVIYAGVIPEKEVYRHMFASNALVLATYREGFGEVVIEAMACHIPVVSTDIPGPGDIITSRKNGLLVPPRNIDELLKAMKEIKDNETLRKSIVINGRDRVEKDFERDATLALQVKDLQNILPKKN